MVLQGFTMFYHHEGRWKAETTRFFSVMCLYWFVLSQETNPLPSAWFYVELQLAFRVPKNNTWWTWVASRTFATTPPRTCDLRPLGRPEPETLAVVTRPTGLVSHSGGFSSGHDRCGEPQRVGSPTLLALRVDRPACICKHRRSPSCHRQTSHAVARPRYCTT